MAYTPAHFQYAPQTNGIVLNVGWGTFMIIRNGDLMAVLNIIEHLRQRDNNRNIKFYLEPTATHNTDYCHQFRDFILKETDYLSPIKGPADLAPTFTMSWQYRMELGEHIHLNITRPKEKKICIFPVFDADYNTFRNWNTSVAQKTIDRFSTSEYLDYKKIFCVKTLPDGMNLKDFEISNDFMTNVEHILSCEIYVGGDTGMSHFASVLNNGPKISYYSPRSSDLFVPFYKDKIEFNSLS
jgi:hypothetical protein